MFSFEIWVECDGEGCSNKILGDKTKTMREVRVAMAEIKAEDSGWFYEGGGWCRSRYSKRGYYCPICKEKR